MRELHAAISDPNLLLALEPEELGAQILLLLRERRERTFSLAGILHDLRQMSDHGDTGYPRPRMHEIERALTEAFCWLEAQVLIVPPDQENGRNGYRTLSRRGSNLKTEEDLRQFRMARQLNRDLLHPAIAEKVWLAFMRGDFADAVFTAMRTVEIAVREAAGFPEGDHGVPMIRRAFHKDTGPLRDPGQEEAEREALMHLFAGAVGSYKNPHSHRNVPMEDAGEATEIVTLASHLLRIVDARRAAQNERQTNECDPDLERQILLAIEAYDGVSEPGHAQVRHLAATSHEADYHVLLLTEAGLISAMDVRTDGDPYEMWPIRLTMAGHEYLDTIRDEEVWRRTKEGARAVGSFSLDALGALAKGLVREKIRKHTGIEVDL